MHAFRIGSIVKAHKISEVFEATTGNLENEDQTIFQFRRKREHKKQEIYKKRKESRQMRYKNIKELKNYDKQLYRKKFPTDSKIESRGALRGAHCEYVNLCAIDNLADSGCVSGQKFVIKVKFSL